MLIDPVLVPTPVSVDVTVIVQDAAEVSVGPQSFVWVKSPVAIILEILSGASPGLVTVTLCAAPGAPSGPALNVSWLGYSAMTGRFRNSCNSGLTPDQL